MEFSKSQLEAINHKNGPCLVLAVPGAGKTTIIINRILNLIEEEKVSPSEILALTFSRASANDMRKRLKQFSKYTTFKNIRTIHSLCFEIVATYNKSKNNPFNMIEDDRFKAFRYKAINDTYKDIYFSNIDIESYLRILSAISTIKCKNLKEITLQVEDELGVKNLKKFYDNYEKVLRDNYLYDFDDLLLEAKAIFENDKKFKNAFKSRFKYILLDEAQDTSDIQWDIIKLLLSKNNNLFVVADDDQSIYKFRGASPYMLMRFEHEFANAKIIYLETNYRSYYEIVNSANRLIKNNKFRYEKELLSNRGKKSKVKVNILKTRQDQYESVVKDIKATKGKKAIIYRNNLSSIGIIDALDKNLLSFNLKDHNIDFFKSSVYKDVCEIISFILNPTDFDLYSKIYYKLQGYVSRAEIEEARYNSQENAIDRVLAIPNLPEYKAELLNDLKLHLRMAAANFKKRGMDIILNNCGYVNFLKQSKREQARSLDSLLRVYNTLISISKDTSIEEFLPRLDQIKKLCLIENSSDIELLTMHSSKGLEFDNVFIIDLIESEIPGSNILTNDLEEERRLLYVGMTRAKENLFMYAYKNDANNKVKISRFFEDLR